MLMLPSSIDKPRSSRVIYFIR